MENNIVIIKCENFKLVSNADVQVAGTLEELPIHPNIVLICSEDVNMYASMLARQNKNVVHLYPSVACMFCFTNTYLLYIRMAEEEQLVCQIEVIVDKQFVKEKAERVCGSLDEIVNVLCVLICDMNKKVLCENIYVDGREDLKKLMEERIMMELGKGICVEYMKFLKVKDEMKRSEYSHDGICEDPVSIGGLVASEVFFNGERGQFMTKKEYENGDFSKLSPFD